MSVTSSLVIRMEWFVCSASNLWSVSYTHLAVMCAHYLFDPDFCNVAAGWEKGIVEKNVQDSRRRIWLDAQDCHFHSFEELNAWLGQRCSALWNELTHPQYSGLSVAEVLELERAEPVSYTHLPKKLSMLMACQLTAVCCSTSLAA